jgi:outer membrane protein OmpA-like peptidoglycan-associated protein
MKQILFILTLFIGVYNKVLAQQSFNWSDSIVKIGETRNIRITMDYKSCNLIPWYKYDDNKLTLDTLVTFLHNNTDISAALIWHTGTLGSSQYNFYYSKKLADALLKELIRIGISERRITAIGLGESRPIISEEEIKSIDDHDRKIQLDSINRRIEIIITSVPVRK